MSNSGEKHSITGNIALSTMYQILTMVIPLITAPYVSRALGPTGIGIYSYTQSYSMYFSLFAALGTVSYGTREIARHRNNRKELSQIFWEIVTLTFIVSAVCIVLWGIWILFNERYRYYYLVLTVSLLGTMVDISWLYAGLEEFKYTVLQNSIFKILGAVAIFVFVKDEGDLGVYLLILSLTTFLANFSMWLYLPKFVSPVNIRGIRIAKHFRETLVYFVPTIATSIYTILDKTLIGLITDDARENGYYEQATKIVNMAKTLSFAGVNMVLQSRISYLFAEDRIDEIKERISVSMDYILFMGSGLCFGLIGVASRFVPLFFGQGYEKTIILLQMLAPVTIIIGISNCLGSQFYNPAGLRAQSAKYIICGSVVNLVLNIILIPKLGSLGAVIATIIAEATISGLYLFNCRGFYLARTLLTQIWKKIAAGIVMCLVVINIGSIIDNGLLAVILQVAIGGTVYCLLLLIGRDSFVSVFIVSFIKKVIKRREING